MPSVRLLTHHAADPYFNMAVDEWLLARAETTPGFAAVRLYSWRPGAITFGVNQRAEKAFTAELAHSTPVIRRVTGGRAIYHDPSELTYAIAANTTAGPVAAWRESRSRTGTAIAQLLQEFLRRAGFDTEYMRQSSTANSLPAFFHSAPCFASHARYELVGTNGKMAASAQRRLDASFLQHGSLKLAGVAPHPALDSPHPANDLPPLERAAFERLVKLFGDAFQVCCGQRLTPFITDQRTVETWSRRAVEVRKNRLLRRVEIKQSNAGVSL